MVGDEDIRMWRAGIIVGLGALTLYLTLYRARLIPRWISIWGMIAIIILLGLVVAAIFVETPPWTTWLLVPIGVLEMVIALWFIYRGFDFRGPDPLRSAEVSP